MKALLVSSSAQGELTGRLRWVEPLAARGVETVFALPAEERDFFAAFERVGAAVRPWCWSRRRRGLGRAAAAIVELAWRMRLERPALVHSFGHEANLLTAAAARLCRFGGPLLQHVTGLGAAFTGGRSPAGAVLAAAYRFNAGRVDAFVFQNDDDPAALAGLPADKVTVCRGSGVDSRRFAPGAQATARGARLRRALKARPDETLVVYIGRLLRDKGLGELLEAWRLLGPRRARLWIVGAADPAARGAIDPAVAGLGRGGPPVEFLGRREDVMEILAAADVFVNPSHREGLPRTNIEAMAMGRAVVTTDAVGCRDTVEDGRSGLIVPVGDAPGLSAALERVMGDRALRERLGAAARVRAVERFEVQVVVDQIVELYKRRLTRRSGGDPVRVEAVGG